MLVDFRPQPFAGFFAFASFEHSSAHFRHASAQRANASTFECLSHALASSSHACAHTPQIGYAYFEPRSSNCVVSVAIRAQSRAVTITDATRFTFGWASPAVTTRSQRRRATLQASIASLNFGGHIIFLRSRFAARPVEKTSGREARFYCRGLRAPRCRLHRLYWRK